MYEEKKADTEAELTPEAAEVVSTEDDDELIWGAVSIGREINRTVPEVYHLARMGIIPTYNAGRQLVSTRRKLRDVANWPGVKNGKKG